MAANLGPVPPGWQSLGRDALETFLVTTPHSRARHKQLLRVSNLEDYLHIGGPGLPDTVAARRLGVSRFTVLRWRAILHRVLACAG